MLTAVMSPFPKSACAGSGLTGRFPDLLPLNAAKFQTLELRNTSLLQCNASHITALANTLNGTASIQPCTAFLGMLKWLFLML